MRRKLAVNQGVIKNNPQVCQADIDIGKNNEKKKLSKVKEAMTADTDYGKHSRNKLDNFLKYFHTFVCQR